MSDSNEIESGTIAITNRTVEAWISHWKKTWGGSPMNKIAMAISLERAADRLREEVSGLRRD